MRCGVFGFAWKCLWFWFLFPAVAAGGVSPLPSNASLRRDLQSGKEATQLAAIGAAHRLPKSRYLALLPSIKASMKDSSFLEVRLSAWVFLLAKRLEPEVALQEGRRWLHHTSENVRRRATRWLLRSGLSDKALQPLVGIALNDRHWLVRMIALKEMSPRPGLVVRLRVKVLGRLKDKEAGVRLVVGELLSKWGYKLWSGLQPLWRKGSPATRQLLLSVSGKLVRQASGVLVWLKEGTKDKDGSVREAAALAMGRLPWTSLPAKAKGYRSLLEALLSALRDKRARVRVAAAWSLGEMGRQLRSSKAKPDAQKIGKAVVREVALLLRSSKRGEVKIAAADALGHFRLELQPALGILVKALDDPDWKVRRAVATTLFRGGPGLAQRVSPALIPGIIKGLFEKQSWVNRVTARILGWMGPRASAAIPYLRKKLKHRDVRVREAARAAIRSIVLP